MTIKGTLFWFHIFVSFLILGCLSVLMYCFFPLETSLGCCKFACSRNKTAASIDAINVTGFISSANINNTWSARTSLSVVNFTYCWKRMPNSFGGRFHPRTWGGMVNGPTAGIGTIPVETTRKTRSVGIVKLVVQVDKNFIIQSQIASRKKMEPFGDLPKRVKANQTVLVPT